MEDIVQASEKRLTDLIGNMKDEIQLSIATLKSDISEVKGHMMDIEGNVSMQAEELERLRSEVTDMKTRHDFLEKQFLLKDIHDRKTNLLFYGIAETPQENTEAVLRNFFVNTLKFETRRVADIYFKVVHRLPVSEYQKKNKANAQKSIIATFHYMPDREAIYEARKLLRGKGFSIQTDLPGMLKKRRAILSRQAAEIREEEKLWTRVRVVSSEVVLESKDPKDRSSTWSRHT